MRVRIDRFIYMSGFVDLRGEISGLEWPLKSAHLCVEGRPIAKAKLQASGAGIVQFCIREIVLSDTAHFRDVSLRLTGPWGKSVQASDLGKEDRREAHGHALFGKFLNMLADQSGTLLEIGSRARSGVVRKHLIPKTWDYVGIDIVGGDNVDVVGDAHSMSSLLPHGEFAAAMSLSVFEHLAMPWKVAVEMGRVMATGGLAYIQTHQTFPIHDAPWDFWRISKDAWSSLFNRHTGFEVMDVGEAEPMRVVPERCHPYVNHGDCPGWALSAAIIRKVGEPVVDWPVPPLTLTRSAPYPG